MKVLLINNFHYRRGGSDVVYLNTIDLLNEKGHETIHFSMVDEQNFESPYARYFVKRKDFLKLNPIRQVFTFFKFFYSVEAVSNLKALLEKERPDIAHIHIFYGGLTSSILGTLRKYGIPVVVTLHEYKLLCPVYTFLDGEKSICEKCEGSKYFHCAIKRCNKGNLFYSVVMAMESYFRDLLFSPKRYFDRIICVSKFSLQKHLQYKADLRNKLTHLYNFSPELERMSLVNRNDGYYLYFGRLSREKGIFTLVEAWKDFPNLALKLVGTGPLEAELEQFVSQRDNISTLGYRSGTDLYDLIRNAAFVVIPSEWYENNPMTIIESYFLGTPVIGSNIGGIPEILMERETGFLFKSNDVQSLRAAIMSSLALDQGSYAQLAQNCRTFAEENFSSTKHYENLIKIYNSVIGV